MTQCARCATPLAEHNRVCPVCGTSNTGPGTDAPVPGDLRAHLELATRGRFEIVRELGRGGMGVVYLAHQTSLDRRVAIKVLHPYLGSDAELARRFFSESRTMSRLDHPNIIPVFDVEEHSGLSYYLMPFVDGSNLRELLRLEPRPPLPKVTRALLEIGSALAYAHKMGVVHRDVKPENILIDPASGRMILTDFGIAKVVSEAHTSMTMTFSKIGSPRYMAPEQGENAAAIDGRADQYALGMIGYEMLAGRPAFDAPNPAEILYKHRYEKPVPLDSIRADAPQALRSAVMRSIRKGREERFSSMEEFVSTLESAIEHPARKETRTERARGARTRPPGGRPRWVWIAGGIGLALVASIVVLLVVQRRQSPPIVPVSQRTTVEGGGTSRPSESDRPDLPVSQAPPVTSIAGPSRGTTDTDVIFDASGTSDPDDPSRLLEVRWDFEGDGAWDTPFSTTRMVSHRYPEAGQFRVTVEARDPAGHLARAQRTVTIEGGGSTPSPSPSEGARAAFVVLPRTGTTMTEFTVDASSSRDDGSPGATLEYRWDWEADGTWDTGWSDAPTARITYEDAGRKRIKLEARAPGRPSGATTETVNVEAPSNPGQVITALIARFRAAAEAEDFLALSEQCYRGDVPAEDRKLLRQIFDRAEGISIDTGGQAFEMGETAGTIEAKAQLKYRLSSTGEAQSMRVRLIFSDAGSKGNWRLLRVKRD